MSWIAAGITATAAITQGVMAANQASNEAEAIREQGQYKARMLEFNAQLAEFAAEDTYRITEKEASGLLTQARKFKGSQRAAAAAQGIEVDEGSSAELQIETDVMSAKQALTIRNNGARQAFGYKMQAVQARMDAQLALRGADKSASNAETAGTYAMVGGFAQAGSSIAGGVRGSSGGKTAPKSGYSSATGYSSVSMGDYFDSRNVG
jgi:Rieske Fe-S protein